MNAGAEPMRRAGGRVAALYDVHGNLPALEAVLAEIGDEGVDRVVVGGDVLPGPMPGECLAALFDLPGPVDFIQGNGERDVLELLDGTMPDRVPERVHGVLRWVAGELAPAHTRRIRAWPSTHRMDVAGLGTVLFCHATPRSDVEIFTRLTPEERLRPVFEPTDAAVVVCGHTHMQFDLEVAGVRVVNAGSVGMPFGEPGAFWLLLGPGIQLRRTTYDVAAAEDRMRATRYPGAAELHLVRPPAEEDVLRAFEAAALGRAGGA